MAMEYIIREMDQEEYANEMEAAFGAELAEENMGDEASHPTFEEIQSMEIPF